ncbi:hypothetical protein [Mesorhizobium sophorae]|uniref:hypothetical protein n=1 Tax=Mesorhizobium sophorae TaxID=1300294 RepID=UPI00315A6D37
MTPAVGGNLWGPHRFANGAVGSLTANSKAPKIAETLGAATMYFPRFLVGMFGTSFIVAIWAGMETGSIWSALVWAVLTLIVLQVGYFLLTLGLFYKRSTKSTDVKPEPVNPVQPLRRDGGVSSPGAQ